MYIDVSTLVTETKKTFELFFTSIHASQKFLYSLCFSIYMKMVNITWFYGPRTTTFAHKVFISTTFITQSFDFKITYFHCWHSRQKLLLFRCKLLNKHNIKVLLCGILQIDVYILANAEGWGTLRVFVWTQLRWLSAPF